MNLPDPPPSLPPSLLPYYHCSRAVAVGFSCLLEPFRATRTCYIGWTVPDYYWIEQDFHAGTVHLWSDWAYEIHPRIWDLAVKTIRLFLGGGAEETVKKIFSFYLFSAGFLQLFSLTGHNLYVLLVTYKGKLSVPLEVIFWTGRLPAVEFNCSVFASLITEWLCFGCFRFCFFQCFSLRKSWPSV